jgi:hypothetical protein
MKMASCADLLYLKEENIRKYEYVCHLALLWIKSCYRFRFLLSFAWLLKEIFGYSTDMFRYFVFILRLVEWIESFDWLSD